MFNCSTKHKISKNFKILYFLIKQKRALANTLFLTVPVIFILIANKHMLLNTVGKLKGETRVEINSTTLKFFILFSFHEIFFNLILTVLSNVFKYFTDSQISHFIYNEHYNTNLKELEKKTADEHFSEFVIKKRAFTDMFRIIYFSIPISMVGIILSIYALAKSNFLLNSFLIILTSFGYVLTSTKDISYRKKVRIELNKRGVEKENFCRRSLESHEVCKAGSIEKSYSDQFLKLVWQYYKTEMKYLVTSENFRLITRFIITVLKVTIILLKFNSSIFELAVVYSRIDDINLKLLSIRADLYFIAEYWHELEYYNLTSSSKETSGINQIASVIPSTTGDNSGDRTLSSSFEDNSETVNLSNRLITNFEATNGDRRLTSSAEGNNGDRQLTSSAEGNNGDRKLISSAEGNNGDRKLTSSAEGTNEDRRISSSAEVANGDRRLSSSAEGTSGDRRLSSSAEGNNGDRRLTSSAEGTSGDRRLSSSAEGNNGDRRLTSSAEGNGETNYQNSFITISEDISRTVQLSYSSKGDRETIHQDAGAIDCYNETINNESLHNDSFIDEANSNSSFNSDYSLNTTHSYPGSCTLLRNEIQAVSRDQRKQFVVQTRDNNGNFTSSSATNKIIIYPKNKILITGPQGCGKTTFITELSGFKGLFWDISIDGICSSFFKRKEFISNLSFCSQKQIIFNNSIFFNLTYGNNLTEEEVMIKLQKINFKKFIDSFKDGLQTNVGTKANGLSGGQRQLLCIIRCLLKEAQIYVFDNPCLFLDIKNRQMVYEVITQLKDKTVIVCSCDNSINQLFDQVYCFE